MIKYPTPAFEIDTRVCMTEMHASSLEAFTGRAFTRKMRSGVIEARDLSTVPTFDGDRVHMWMYAVRFDDGTGHYMREVELTVE